LWNGEIFGGGISVPVSESDTACLSKVLGSLPILKNGPGEVVQALSQVHGPFAFIYYHAATKQLFFGRDPFGRRSLLAHRGEDGKLMALCSTQPQPIQDEDGVKGAAVEVGVWEELSVRGVHVVKFLERQHVQEQREIPWPDERIKLSRKHVSVDARPEDGVEASASVLLNTLRSAVQRRVDCFTSLASSENESRMGVLFSGGLDSVVLAVLLHQCLHDHPSEPIDLINVSFFASDGLDHANASPDRLAGIAASVELHTLFPSRPWRFVHVDVGTKERQEHEGRICSLIKPRDTSMDLNLGTAFWFASRGRGYLRAYSANEREMAMAVEEGGRPLLRIGAEGAARGMGIPREECSATVEEENNEKREGGKLKALSCANETCRRVAKKKCLLALCSKCCYAFQNKRNEEEEKLFCPAHKNCRSDEGERSEVLLEKDAEEQLRPLLFPSEDGAACVVDEYRSTCKALLVGIGADEQMAGYGRHRSTFLHGGLQALELELDMDLSRLWKRNLGRDDRCISDHGREAWFPYLDEEVVSLLQQLTIGDIAHLHEPPGQGDKKILRLCAKSLGLVSCQELVKRAVQFGTRIAKHTNIMQSSSNRKSKGSDPLGERKSTEEAKKCLFV